MSERILIIGAGMAGLACARRLSDAGLSPVVLDKGRGIGGRMATRRVTLQVTPGHGELRFDHGAQYISAKDPGFAETLAAMREAKAADLWDDGAQRPHYVGLPGMSGLPRALAEGLDVRQNVEVTALRRTADAWTVEAGAESLLADRVVLAIPAPQVAGLLGSAHPLSAHLGSVAMAPCLTLMAAFARDAPRPFISRTSDDDPLAWIAQDSSKPGRPNAATAWVAQAGPEWSARYLEDDRETIAKRMLPMLCRAIGTTPEDALYAGAHRWRYARVTTPLGQPFLRSDDATLHLGGDWCLGARVEAAWQSGDAIAHDILKG